MRTKSERRQSMAKKKSILDLYKMKENGEKDAEVPGLGYAFVQYSSVLEAAQAAKNLRLKTFNGKQVQVDYYPLSMFLKDVGKGEDCDG